MFYCAPTKALTRVRPLDEAWKQVWTLGQQLPYYVAVDIRQPEITPLRLIGQLCMIKSQQLQERRVKVVHMAPRLSDKKRALRVLRDIENDVSRYLFTITVINAAFGLSVGVAVWALGLPNAILWGVAAGLLNYIPYVGGLVGTLAMIAVSIISFPTLQAAALPPIAATQLSRTL